MLKNRFIIIGILLSASLMGSVVTLGVTETGIEIAVPKYTVGDFWIYNSTQFQNISGVIRYEVGDIKEVQDYWNETHECYQINSSMGFTMELENQTAEGLVKVEIYERTVDLFTIESIVEANVTVADDDYSENSFQHYYFQYPGPPTIFPLILGSEFDVSYNVTRTIIVYENEVERIMLFEESGLNNFSVSISDSFHTITTPAGIFECVEITTYTGDENVNVTNVRYYSADVGRDVKNEMIQELQGGFSNIKMISGEELLEYERASAPTIPGFSFLGIFCLLGITAIIIHQDLKNRRKKLLGYE